MGLDIYISYCFAYLTTNTYVHGCIVIFGTGKFSGWSHEFNKAATTLGISPRWTGVDDHPTRPNTCPMNSPALVVILSMDVHEAETFYAFLIRTARAQSYALNIISIMSNSTTKRTLDAFFKPPAKKAKVSEDETSNGEQSSLNQQEVSLSNVRQRMGHSTLIQEGIGVFEAS